MGYKLTHEQLLDQAEALLHQAQRVSGGSSVVLARIRLLCAKARIYVNRASTATTWFGRKISAADLVRATELAVALDGITPPSGADMTVYEAAAQLGVGHERVTRYIHDGRLPATKFGSQWRLRTADVQAFQRRSTGRPSTHREVV